MQQSLVFAVANPWPTPVCCTQHLCCTTLDTCSCQTSQQPHKMHLQRPKARVTAMWGLWKMQYCTMPTSSTSGTLSWRPHVPQKQKRSTSDMQTCCRVTWDHVMHCMTRYGSMYSLALKSVGALCAFAVEHSIAAARSQCPPAAAAVQAKIPCR